VRTAFVSGLRPGLRDPVCPHAASAGSVRPRTGICGRGASFDLFPTLGVLILRPRDGSRSCAWVKFRAGSAAGSAHAAPHESKLSCAFSEFAQTELPQQLHAAVNAATRSDARLRLQRE